MVNVEGDPSPSNEIIGNRTVVFFSLVFIAIGLFLIIAPLVTWELRSGAILKTAVEQMVGAVIQTEPENRPPLLQTLNSDQEISRVIADALGSGTSNLVAGGAAVTAASYPAIHWVGLFCLAFGASVLLGKLVVLDAVAAGTAELPGFALPVRLGGTALLFVFLVLTLGFASERLQLSDISDRSDHISQDLVLTNEALANARIELEAALANLKTADERIAQALEDQRLAELDQERAQTELLAYRQVLTGQMSRDDGIDLLRLEVFCPRMEESIPIEWHDPGDRNRRVAPSVWNDGSVQNPSRLRAVRLQMTDHLTFRLLTSDQRTVLDTRFSYSPNDGLIVATISPSNRSDDERASVTLDQLCSDLEDQRTISSNSSRGFVED